LYVCLKMDLPLEDLAHISSVSDFISYDPDFELLKAQSFFTVSLIARIFTADSLRHSEQAEYWLRYM
jgi:hypothetical protein